MSPLAGTGGMDLILGIGAVLAVAGLVKGWRSFLDDEFTPADRRVAMQVSVFIVPPVVVLLHELGHMAATLAVGGRVTSFHYGLFEGSVGFAGVASTAAVWFVAVAGNVVSAVVGGTMVVAGGLGTRIRRPLRYVLILGGLFEFVFALVGYPLLSESARFGDWLLIYDFGANPFLSWATLAVHAALLVAMWRWWQDGLRHTLFAVTWAEEDRLAELTAAVQGAPADIAPRIDLANLFAGHGDLKLAAAALDEGVAAADEPARLHLARARLAMFRRQWNEAVLATRAGLADERADGYRQELWANQGLALAQMERAELALAAFAHVGPALADDPRVRYGRAVARLASGDADGGRADLAAVVAALPEGEPLRRWAQGRLDGRPLEAGGDGGTGTVGRATRGGPRRPAPQAPITAV
ncbi:MAG: hypothetical protein ABR511_02180 [Acidimicrobiales bacterium]